MIFYQKLKNQAFIKKAIYSAEDLLPKEELTENELAFLNELYDKTISELSDFGELSSFNVKNINNNFFGIVNYYDINGSFKQKRF